MIIAAQAAIVGAEDALPAWVPPAARRRMDPIQRLACAVADRVGAAPGALPPATAVAISTSFGSVDTTLRFADSIARFGDRGASPTPFTTSVHNSAAAALGEMLGLHGPCATLSNGGTGTLAALRLAELWLRAGRAPAVLVLVGDRLNAWGHRVVAALAGAPWPVGDGMAGFLCRPDGPGAAFGLGAHPGAEVLDGGALTAADEARLAAAAAGRPRRRAPDLLGRWWPCSLAAALPGVAIRPLQLREIEHGSLIEGWLA